MQRAAPNLPSIFIAATSTPGPDGNPCDIDGLSRVVAPALN
jgi:hypothetical protein